MMLSIHPASHLFSNKPDYSDGGGGFRSNNNYMEKKSPSPPPLQVSCHSRYLIYLIPQEIKSQITSISSLNHFEDCLLSKYPSNFFFLNMQITNSIHFCPVGKKQLKKLCRASHSFSLCVFRSISFLGFELKQKPRKAIIQHTIFQQSLIQLFS